MRKLSLLLFIFISLSASAQKEKPEALRLFVDCNAWCDMNFIKTEINFVDYVPDRLISNVYLLITSQPTGGGGEEITLFFSGRQQFYGMEDTLQFNRSSVGSEDEYRKQLVQFMKLGLTRFLAKTTLADRISISSTQHDGSALNSDTKKKDPWNAWVMSVRLNGNYRKDDHVKNYSYSPGVSASKTTEKIKISTGAYYNKSLRELTTDQGKRILNNENYSLYTHLVRSVTEHWSFGGSAFYDHSTYSNYDKQISMHAAAEYSFFPYKESVKKAITVYYAIGPSWNDYIDSSYYGKMKDQVVQHALAVNVALIQKWGTIYSNIEWESFLNEFTLQNKKVRGLDVNNFSIGVNADVRIFKGLSFYGYVGYDITEGIYPNILRKDFTIDDLLENVNQYPTSNQLQTYFGLRYQFGSIYNNIVNPRFRDKF